MAKQKRTRSTATAKVNFIQADQVPSEVRKRGQWGAVIEQLIEQPDMAAKIELNGLKAQSIKMGVKAAAKLAKVDVLMKSDDQVVYVTLAKAAKPAVATPAKAPTAPTNPPAPETNLPASDSNLPDAAPAAK